MRVYVCLCRSLCVVFCFGYVYTRSWTYAHTETLIHTYTYIYIHTTIHISSYIHNDEWNVCLCVFFSSLGYVNMSSNIHAFTYVDSNIHTFTHTLTFTYTQLQAQRLTYIFIYIEPVRLQPYPYQRNARTPYTIPGHHHYVAYTRPSNTLPTLSPYTHIRTYKHHHSMRGK